MRWTTGLPHATLLTTPTPWRLARAWRLGAGMIFAFVFLGIFHARAAAQIVLDGTMNEPDWHLLGTSEGGPPPSFGAGNEINALYAEIDATHLYLGVAGNVRFGSHILVFIDSAPGGYGDSNFGRVGAPPGVSPFNPGTIFDDNFVPDYVLSIGTDIGRTNYFWDLYTLSGSFGNGGGPNLVLGDRNNPDLRANPANNDLMRGFEARLTYSATGDGMDIRVARSQLRMMALYINDNGTVSNQFIAPADEGEINSFGSGPILFNSASPDFVRFGHMVVVNEVDYVQPGANTSEFIELKNITSLSVNLDNYRLRLARSTNSPPDVYREIDLPDVNLNPGDYFVICTNVANVPTCDLTVEPPQDLLENALPAAVALVQNNIIMDGISYGGNTGAPYTEASGFSPGDDGTQQALGISRVVDGLDTNRNNVDFALRCTTPGATNSTQTSACGPATPTLTPTPTPTGTSSAATPTSTPTNTSTPTPTGSVTPGVPAGCSNILVNGNFESASGWEFGGSPVPGKYTSIPVRGGIRAVQLGIPPESGYAPTYSYSSIRQAVSIPRGSTVQLRWWHYHRTDLSTLDSTTNTQDRQEVILLKPNGDTLRVVQRVRRNDNSWQQDIVDLTEYAGHNFVLYFNVLNYGSGRTWTFLDDIELLVCAPGSGSYPTVVPTTAPGVTATPTHTFTPTPTPTLPGTPGGNSVEQDGYGLTVLAVENPSTRPGPLYQPQPGHKLVGVQIVVRNISGESFSSNALSATLVDASGFLYGAEFSSAIQGGIELLEVNPGEMVQGWVGFIIPENSTPASLRYQFFGSGAILQVGLGAANVSSSDAFLNTQPSAETPTPTVTPTNTDAPSPTLSPTGTTQAFVPNAPVDNAVQPENAARQPAAPTLYPVAAPQVAPTPTVQLIVERPAIPANCLEVVDNGSFDGRGVGWSQEGGTILPAFDTPDTDVTGSAPSGTAVRLGLVDEVAVAGISAMQQLVQLPATTNKITLRFRYFPVYAAPLTSGDYQYVDIYHGRSGQFAGRALGVQQNDRVWIEREYDLSALAGEAVRLFFMVSNDGVGGNIAMYIDDISILACRVPPPQNSLAARDASPRVAAGAVSPQPTTIAQALAADVQPQPGFSFGRLGGLLAVLGIAGAALVLLPLTRRLTK